MHRIKFSVDIDFESKNEKERREASAREEIERLNKNTQVQPLS